MKLSLILVSALFFVSGCTTIQFDNGPTPKKGVLTSKWHHNFVFALYEGSSPINLKKECNGKKWESVKTELSFFNGASSGVVNAAAGAAVVSGSGGLINVLPLWNPKSVEITCGV